MYRICDDLDLITSDNPVTMYSLSGRNFSVFDPTNIIHLPLDNKHYLTIMPNTEPAHINRIHREDRDKWFGYTINLEVDRSSEDWIIGKPNTIQKHIYDQKKLEEENNPENLQALEDIKEKFSDATELLNLINKEGTHVSLNVANKVKELLKKKIHVNDTIIRQLAVELNKAGFTVE